MVSSYNVLRLLGVIVGFPLLMQFGTVLFLFAAGGEERSVPIMLVGIAALVGAALLVRPLLRVWPIPRRTAVVTCLLCLGVAAVGMASVLGLPGAGGLRVGPLALLLSPVGLGLSVVAAAVLLLTFRERVGPGEQGTDQCSA